MILYYVARQAKQAEVCGREDRFAGARQEGQEFQEGPRRWCECISGPAFRGRAGNDWEPYSWLSSYRPWCCDWLQESTCASEIKRGPSRFSPLGGRLTALSMRFVHLALFSILSTAVVFGFTASRIGLTYRVQKIPKRRKPKQHKRTIQNTQAGVNLFSSRVLNIASSTKMNVADVIPKSRTSQKRISSSRSPVQNPAASSTAIINKNRCLLFRMFWYSNRRAFWPL